MSDDLASMMETFATNAEKLLVPDTQTKQAMTEVGAKVMAEKLKENTPRSNHNDVKYRHLQDNIGYQNTDIDGEVDGSSVVGFGKKGYVARFLNDGTVKMRATHFVDNTRRESADDVFDAERKIYDERMGN